jgi:uracil-DNA glycosylase
MTGALDRLVAEIGACTLCASSLPLGPRPVLRASNTAKLLIVGQAPGTKVHETGIPWNDASGDRLRDWLSIDRDVFYDAAKVAIVPMGFCYPGRLARGGDCPPRPECARTWHGRLLPLMPTVELIVLAGVYAQAYFLGKERKNNLTETVRAWRDYGPRHLPLPHPSWRTIGWQKRNPWFDAEVLPHLRDRVRRLL